MSAQLSTTMNTDSPSQALRASGPLAVIALIAFVGSIVATGGDALELATSPFSIAASVAGLTALVALSLGMGSLRAGVPALQTGAGHAGWLIACIGTILAAGGQWTQLFVLPGIAGPAPDLAANGIGTVVAGYVASYLVLGIGWLTVGVVLLRSGSTTTGTAWLAIAGAAVCIAPLPVRFVVIAVAATLISRKTGA